MTFHSSVLRTERILTYFDTTSIQPNYSNNFTQFRVDIPRTIVDMAKPLTYDFRVAEWVDDLGAIRKVGLQVQVWEHDSSGNGNVIQNWIDVPRVQLPYVE